MEALRLQPLGRTTAVFSMVLGFILSKTLCPQRHSKVCFELLKTFGVTLQRPCPAGLVASPKSGSPCSNLTIVCAIPLLPHVPLNPFYMNTERKRGGRIPKLNPKSHHVMLRFDDDEWMKFLVMYEQTDVKAKAVFAKARIFGEPFKVLREDKTLVEYYTKLSSFHSQYRMIGNNYNRIKEDVKQIVMDELGRIANDENLKHLIQKA